MKKSLLKKIALFICLFFTLSLVGDVEEPFFNSEVLPLFAEK